MVLGNLNHDCLLYLFKYIPNEDLLNLCNTSWDLQVFIEEYILHARTRDILMCGHGCGSRIFERTLQPFTYADRVKMNRNWLQGNLREYQYLSYTEPDYVRLHLEHDWLYLSISENFGKMRRTHEEPLRRDFERQPEIKANDKICGFVKHDDTIFVGRNDGHCSISERGVVTDYQLNMTEEYLLDIDFANDIYVTTAEFCARIWRRSNKLKMMREIKQEYRAIRLNDSGNRFYCGSVYENPDTRSVLREYDVESGVETILNSKTQRIYDLKVNEDETKIFTVNYSKKLLMYDRRTNEDGGTWTDQYGWSRLEHDGNNAVLCAGAYDPYIHLIDTRVTKYPVRSYYLRSNDSELRINSIACDSRYLFVATNRGLHVLDFKSDRDPIENSIPIISSPKRNKSF